MSISEFKVLAFTALIFSGWSFGLHAVAQTSITTIDLPAPGNGFTATGTYGRGVNDSGQVVGYTSFSVDGPSYFNPTYDAFVSGPNGAAVPQLPSQAARWQTNFGLGINDAGLFTGGSKRGEYTNGVLTYLTKPLPESVGKQFATGHNVAYGIGIHGEVVGIAGQSAFLKYSDDWPIFLPNLNGGSWALAYGISQRNGYISGMAADNKGKLHAVLWDQSKPTSAPKQIDQNGLPPSYTKSLGYGVNDTGRVVGHLANDSNSQVQAFVTDVQGGALKPLGVLTGYSNSRAFGINNTGQVVGWSDGEDSDPVTGNPAEVHVGAFLYPGDGKPLVDLSLLAGQNLADAYGINSFAQIAGTTVDKKAYLLTLHPNWTGKSGTSDWRDSGNWDFGRAGELHGLVPGRPHDVEIAPSVPITVIANDFHHVNSVSVGREDRTGVMLMAKGSYQCPSNSCFRTETIFRTVQDMTIAKSNYLTTSIAVLEIGGTLINSGQITLDSTSIGTDFSVLPLVGGRILNNQSARITVTPATSEGGEPVVQTTFYSEVKNQGQLVVEKGAMAIFEGLVTGTGQYGGLGQFEYRAGFHVGNSPAIVTHGGQVVFTSSSVLMMDIGGTTSGVCDDCYSKLIFTGGVNFGGGTLRVTQWNGFTFANGQTFDLFDFDGGAPVGTFGTVELPALAGLGDGSLYWDKSALYSTGVVRVVPEPATYAMMFVGLLALGWAGRRKVSSS